jgi:hypothetical protein
LNSFHADRFYFEKVSNFADTQSRLSILMQTNDLAQYILSKPRFNALKKLVEERHSAIYLQGLHGSAAAMFLAPLKITTNQTYILF